MSDRSLLREILWVLAIKLVLLLALWAAFFRGQGVTVVDGADLPAFRQSTPNPAPNPTEDPAHAR